MTARSKRRLFFFGSKTISVISGPMDDVDADQEQDQRRAAHRREIGLRVPE